MGRRKNPTPPKKRNHLERIFGFDLWDAHGKPLFPVHVTRVSKAVKRRFGDTEPTRTQVIAYFRSEQFLLHTPNIGNASIRWVYRSLRLGLPPALDLSVLDDLLALFPDIRVDPIPGEIDHYKATLGVYTGRGLSPSQAVEDALKQYRAEQEQSAWPTIP